MGGREPILRSFDQRLITLLLHHSCPDKNPLFLRLNTPHKERGAKSKSRSLHPRKSSDQALTGPRQPDHTDCLCWDPNLPSPRTFSGPHHHHKQAPRLGLTSHPAPSRCHSMEGVFTFFLTSRVYRWGESWVFRLIVKEKHLRLQISCRFKHSWRLKCTKILLNAATLGPKRRRSIWCN